MDEVLRLRRQIDQIDLEIIQLLKDRYESARFLGRIKRARRLPLRDPQRETAIMRRMDRVAGSIGLKPTLVRSVYRQIFALAVDAQKKNTRIEYQLEGLHALVIGGTGGMGRFFAQFMQLRGANVKIVGRNQSHTKKIAKETNVESGSLDDAKRSNIIIVSVPIERTQEVALKAAARMSGSSLLMDLSSVKTGITDRISERLPNRMEFVSLHPLFSPEVRSLTGQTIVAIPFHHGPLWQRFSKVLSRAGARVEISSLKKHDLTMSYVQVIHHFALLSLGVSLNKWNGDFRTSALAQTEARIRGLLGIWPTIMGIQSQNPFAHQARDRLVSTVSRLRDMKPSSQRCSRRTLTRNVQKWTRKT